MPSATTARHGRDQGIFVLADVLFPQRHPGAPSKPLNPYINPNGSRFYRSDSDLGCKVARQQEPPAHETQEVEEEGRGTLGKRRVEVPTI